MIKRIALSFLTLIVLIAFACNRKVIGVKKTDTPQIMAYYVPSKSKPVTELPLDKLTHIIFSFTKIIDGKMNFENVRLQSDLMELMAASSRFPQLKVMIACGGWGGSAGFSDMVLDKSSRTVFIESVVAFIKEYKLDGIDLDWEYPGLPGIGNTYRPEDKENFTALVAELRAALDLIGPDMLLTFAAAGWEKYFDYIELQKVMDQVDYMNIMTYDLAGGNISTRHHTALYNSKDSKKSSLSTDQIVQFCLERGIDPIQIVIGGAFYGRTWAGVNPENDGLYQPFDGSKSSMSFAQIQSLLVENDHYKRYWDDQAMAPYVFSKVDSTFISYDDPESLQYKSKYVLENQLGGIMFWQLTHDTKDHDLVNSIYNQMGK